MLDDRPSAASGSRPQAQRPHRIGLKETAMILTFLYAAAAAAVLGLPADYTWRRARRLAPLAALFSAIAIVATVWLAGRIGLVDGAGAILALIFGLIAGGIAADALASRQWGRAHHQY
jgi:hypothetical protein